MSDYEAVTAKKQAKNSKKSDDFTYQRETPKIQIK